MAITTAWAPRVFECAFNKEIDINTDTINMKAFTATSWGYSRDNDMYMGDFTGTELSGGGYAVKTLSSPTVNYDSANDRFYVDAADVTYSSLETDTSGIPRYFVIYDYQTANLATSPIIAVIDLGDSTTGIRHSADLVLQWNASGIVGTTVS